MATTTPTPTPTTPARRPASRRRAVLAGLLLGLPLLLGMPQRGAADDAPEVGDLIGNWRYLDQTDGLGIRRRTAYTQARGNGSGGDLVAFFSLRERDGEGSVLLLLDSDNPASPAPALLCEEHGAPRVMLKFGDHGQVPAVCDTEASGSSRVLFLGPVLPLWLNTAFGETLSIGVTVAERGMVVFTFPVGHVEWQRLLDPYEARYFARMIERSRRGQDTTDMWEMEAFHDFRESDPRERPEQKSPATAGAIDRDLHSSEEAPASARMAR